MFFFITHPHRPRVTFACNSLETRVSQADPVDRRRPVATARRHSTAPRTRFVRQQLRDIRGPLPSHHRSRPSRDIVNVSTIEPRRTVTVKLETPYPIPRESYTVESRLDRKTIPYSALSCRRDIDRAPARSSTVPAVVSSTTATGARRVIADWRAIENSAARSATAARTDAPSRIAEKRGAASPMSRPTSDNTITSSRRVNANRRTHE